MKEMELYRWLYKKLKLTYNLFLFKKTFQFSGRLSLVKGLKEDLGYIFSSSHNYCSVLPSIKNVNMDALLHIILLNYYYLNYTL